MTPQEKKARREHILQSVAMDEIEATVGAILYPLQAVFGDHPIELIRSKRGKDDIIDARRALVSYLMDDGFTSLEVKRYIGYGCHSSVLNLYNGHKAFMEYNGGYRNKYNKFLKLIRKAA